MKGIITPKPLAPAEPAAAPARAHILVVDSDPEVRKLLRMNLEAGGYEVSMAEDAVVAGHRVVARLPDLIIVGSSMPFMSGPEFIAALRADATIPDLPVIFVAPAQEAPALVGSTFGFPLSTKPLVLQRLLAAVAAELRLRRPPSR